MARKVLIVEDDPAAGYVLVENLRRQDFEPTLLQEGKPAVPWVQQHQPDLITLDLMLPDMDGYDICEQLKLDPATNLIPIIIISARDRAEDKVHGLEVGANHYLTKPFTRDQLHQAIATVLDWREELRQSGTEGEVNFKMQSDTQALEELNHLLEALTIFSGLAPEKIRQLTTAVRELGTNAIEWGHKYQLQRIITATYHIDPEKITITIRDTGPGFDPKNLPHAAQEEESAPAHDGPPGPGLARRRLRHHACPGHGG